ncbi:MAG: agmatinase [Phycisphaerae bacterium]|nr:agmatinase [Phycisphaerae bacterium]NUQ44972.1 agmatinase [Phycisphaerae bacterium]
MESIPDNFLGLPERYSAYAAAHFAVLPIPYDSTTSFQVGTRHGPRAIITASQQVELFDDELGDEFHTAGIVTLPPLAPNMAGPEQQLDDVFTAARKVTKDGKFLLALGGEHSITSGLVRAVRQRHKSLCVLQVDAHADLRDEWEGTPFSHACVMRRIVDMGVPIVQVGIRNYSREEHQFMKRRHLAPITAWHVNAKADWMRQALEGLTDDVYVTIDIDGFDPAFAPGTGTPEPGGLHWFHVAQLLRQVAEQKRIVAADIVEVMPIPGSMQTEFLAAKLAYKLIAYVQRGRK